MFLEQNKFLGYFPILYTVWGIPRETSHNLQMHKIRKRAKSTHPTGKSSQIKNYLKKITCIGS